MDKITEPDSFPKWSMVHPKENVSLLPLESQWIGLPTITTQSDEDENDKVCQFDRRLNQWPLILIPLLHLIVEPHSATYPVTPNRLKLEGG